MKRILIVEDEPELQELLCAYLQDAGYAAAVAGDGAAALDLCQVAAGRVEVFGECCLSPWDYAAGSLIITEAGGIVTDFADTAPNVLRPSSVFASNARCHSVLKELEL